MLGLCGKLTPTLNFKSLGLGLHTYMYSADEPDHCQCRQPTHRPTFPRVELTAAEAEWQLS